jgi:hypothetical protein
MATQNVRQTIALTADGQITKYASGSAVTITRARIMAVQAQSSAADGSVKIYNEADSSKTASALVFEAKWGTADNTEISIKVPGEGIYCDTGMYADLTNCDFLVVTGTFT